MNMLVQRTCFVYFVSLCLIASTESRFQDVQLPLRGEVHMRLTLAAAEFVKLAPPTLSLPFFQKVTKPTPNLEVGLYYNLGRIHTDSSDFKDGDVSQQLLRQEVWLVALDQAFRAEFPHESFWAAPTAHAHATLEKFETADNAGKISAVTAEAIAQAMYAERAAVEKAISKFAQTNLNLPARVAPSRVIASDTYIVRWSTLPAGGDVQYLPFEWALDQMVKADASHPHGRKFPDELEYLPLTGNPASLGGPYTFKVVWHDKTRFFKMVPVKGSTPLVFPHG